MESNIQKNTEENFEHEHINYDDHQKVDIHPRESVSKKTPSESTIYFLESEENRLRAADKRLRAEEEQMKSLREKDKILTGLLEDKKKNIARRKAELQADEEELQVMYVQQQDCRSVLDYIEKLVRDTIAELDYKLAEVYCTKVSTKNTQPNYIQSSEPVTEEATKPRDA
jgi:DNA repair exonuclease SbcCD ATPase subunit